MIGFFATLAIAGAVLILGLLIVHFSSGQESNESIQDPEQLRQQLLKIERAVRETRESYHVEKA